MGKKKPARLSGNTVSGFATLLASLECIVLGLVVGYIALLILGAITAAQGGSAMTRAQLMEKGLNDSAIHEDVMIGAPDTHITGVTKDGKEVTIFVGGEWAF